MRRACALGMCLLLACALAQAQTPLAAAMDLYRSGDAAAAAKQLQPQASGEAKGLSLRLSDRIESETQ